MVKERLGWEPLALAQSVRELCSIITLIVRIVASTSLKELIHLLQSISAYLQRTLAWCFLGRHNTSVFLELIFILAWSHVAEKR